MWEHNERMKGEGSSMPDQEVLIKRRKMELKHAQDVKEMFERKLEKVNDLYLELHSMKLQLEERERTVSRRERQISVYGSKIHYKKKLKRTFLSKTPDRFRPRGGSGGGGGRNPRNASPSTPEALSTSPESPVKSSPTPTQAEIFAISPRLNLPPPLPSANPSTKIVVRENPVFRHLQSSSSYSPPAAVRGAAGIDWEKIKQMHNYSNNRHELVRERSCTHNSHRSRTVRG